jgi:hypothetical protein
LLRLVALAVATPIYRHHSMVAPKIFKLGCKVGMVAAKTVDKQDRWGTVASLLIS